MKNKTILTGSHPKEDSARRSLPSILNSDTKNDLSTSVETRSKALNGRKKQSPKHGDDPHPIRVAIEKFLSRARDIELAARTFVPLSHENKKEQFDESISNLNDAVGALSKGNKSQQVKALSMLIDCSRKLTRLENSDVPAVIQTSLFLGLFSFYDAFTGDLMRALYSKKPILFEKLNRSIELSAILGLKSFDELKASILEDEIEQFRRDSYVKQFNNLESTFGLNTLRAFTNWPDFVECTQRRNLQTHNDGRVNSQYIKICEQEGYRFIDKPEIGATLNLDPQYLISACELTMEVALKLGQTLWRKLFPDESRLADDHLIEAIYDGCLLLEEWDRAITFGDFAISQKNLADRASKMLTVNYAIGLKFSGDDQATTKVLSGVDWSGAAVEFRLAKAVLSDDFVNAGRLMLEVGSRSSIIPENGYHEFPLFRVFRQTSEFAASYAQVFGHEFTTELKRRVRKEKVQAVKESKKEAALIRKVSPPS